MTTFEDYCAIPAVNWSHLKHMADPDGCPEEYLWHQTHQDEDTEAKALGRAIHVAVLEPDDFPRRYTLWNPKDGTRATNAYKAFAAASEAAGLEVLLKPDYDKCLAVRDAVHAHPVAAGLLTGGQSEVTITWTDPATGLPCKARLDYLRPDMLVDLKSTVSINNRLFGIKVAKMKHHCQLAHYHNGLGLTADVAANPGPVKIIAVKQKPPHVVSVVNVPDDALYAGEQEVAELLARVRSCTDSGVWPGRYETEQTLELPGWVFQDQQQDEMELTGLIPAKGGTP